MCDMLPACFCIVESDIRFDWMYYLWLFCWDYVARHNQVFHQKDFRQVERLCCLLLWRGLGGSIGPGIVGRVTQSAGDNIRAVWVGLLFPVTLLIMLLFLQGKRIINEIFFPKSGKKAENSQRRIMMSAVNLFLFIY